MQLVMMTVDKKAVVLLKEGDYNLSVVKSDSTNTKIFDFTLNGEAYAMATVAEKLYLDLFDSPNIKLLATMLDFLKEDFGGMQIEIGIAE